MKTTTITIEVPNGKRAEWVNGVLTLVDEAPQRPKDVTEHVKTFEEKQTKFKRGDEVVILNERQTGSTPITHIVNEEHDGVVYMDNYRYGMFVSSVALAKAKEQPKFKPADVRESVKTFEDACEELGEDNELVLQYNQIERYLAVCAENADIHAYLKLRIIVAALNEGWQPKFTENEKRWYPWFYLYSQEEIDNMAEDEKKQLWRFGGSSSNGSYCGLASAFSSYAWSRSCALFSARLALKTEELAKYCGRQFIDIWADYILIRRGEDELQTENA